MRALALASSCLVGCTLGFGSGEDPPDLTGATAYEYRVTAVEIPSSSTEQTMFGLDLDSDERDGDPGADNQLGGVLAAMNSLDVGGFPVEAAFNTQLADDVAWMVTVLEGERAAGVALTRGVVGPGGLAPSPADAAPALGYELGDVLAGDVAMLPLGALTDAYGVGGAGFVQTIRARVRVDSFTPQRVVLTVGAGIPLDDLDAIMIPNIAAYMTTRLALGPAEVIADYFDYDGDRVVTVEELRMNNLVMSLLGSDVTLDGTDALSLGIQVTAVAY